MSSVHRAQFKFGWFDNCRMLFARCEIFWDSAIYLHVSVCFPSEVVLLSLKYEKYRVYVVQSLSETRWSSRSDA